MFLYSSFLVHLLKKENNLNNNNSPLESLAAFAIAFAAGIASAFAVSGYVAWAKRVAEMKGKIQ